MISEKNCHSFVALVSLLLGCQYRSVLKLYQYIEQSANNASPNLLEVLINKLKIISKPDPLEEFGNQYVVKFNYNMKGPLSR